MSFQNFILMTIVASFCVFGSVKGRALNDLSENEISILNQGIWNVIAFIQPTMNLTGVSCMFMRMSENSDGTHRATVHFKRNGKIHTDIQPGFDKDHIIDIEFHNEGKEVFYSKKVDESIVFTLLSRRIQFSDAIYHVVIDTAWNLDRIVKYISHNACPKPNYK